MGGNVGRVPSVPTFSGVGWFVLFNCDDGGVVNRAVSEDGANFEPVNAPKTTFWRVIYAQARQQVPSAIYDASRP